jgi:peptidoglycan/LPS O-acetylase OafA/YrhL
MSSLIVGTVLLVWFIALAYLSVRFYDEPVSAWLKARYKKKNNASREVK